MSANDFIQGEVVRLSLSVADALGAPAEPGALRLKVKSPAAVVTTYTYGGGVEIVHDDLGLFHADVPLPAAGLWAWRWELDAPNAGAAEGLVTVLKSRVI